MTVDATVLPDWLDKVYRGSCADLSMLPNDSVHNISTSPPYETQRLYDLSPDNIGNYAGADYIAKMRRPLQEMYRVLRPDGSAFINFMHARKDGFASPTLYQFPALLAEVGFLIVQVLWWVKTNARPTADQRVLKNAAEPIYHVVKTKDYFGNKNAIRRPSLYAGRDQRDWKYNPLGADPGNWLCPAMARLNRMSVQDVMGMILDDEGNVLPLRKTQNQTTLHPACWPEELVDWLILYGSRPGDVCLDGFLGGGTTICRAKALGRHFVGVEIVPEYARVAEERIAQVRFGEALDGQGVGGARKQPVKTITAASAPAEMACGFCKTLFKVKKKGQLYCSDKCRYTHHNRNYTRVRGIRSDGTKADVDGSGGESSAQTKNLVHLDEQAPRPASEGPGPSLI